MKQYQIEFYAPKTIDSWIKLESDSPFGSVSKGDIINASWFPDALSNDRFRVIAVEHLFWEKDKIAIHKICIYTEAIDDDQFLKDIQN